jgi:hypothetical protein
MDKLNKNNTNNKKESLTVFDMEKLKKFFMDSFDGNYCEIGRQLKLDTSHIYKFFNFQFGGGKKIIAAIFLYFRKNEIDVNEYLDWNNMEIMLR